MVIALIDDDPHERNYLSSLILSECKKLGIPIKQFSFFENGNDFLKGKELHQYDLIILDIFIGEMSGIDLAYEIRRQNKYVRIVFCSTSNDFACESYNVGASYYIQKPVTSQDITQMIERLDIEDYELRRFIQLPDQQQVLLRNIVYAEYSNHVITIHKKTGPDTKTRLALNQFIDIIKEFSFFITCNKGTIVNLYEVAEWNSGFFTMKNGVTVTISRRRKKEVECAYRHFLFTLAREVL